MSAFAQGYGATSSAFLFAQGHAGFIASCRLKIKGGGRVRDFVAGVVVICVLIFSVHVCSPTTIGELMSSPEER